MNDPYSEIPAPLRILVEKNLYKRITSFLIGKVVTGFKKRNIS